MGENEKRWWSTPWICDERARAEGGGWTRAGYSVTASAADAVSFSDWNRTDDRVTVIRSFRRPCPHRAAGMLILAGHVLAVSAPCSLTAGHSGGRVPENPLQEVES